MVLRPHSESTAVLTPASRLIRRRRANQAGLTLIEILVSMAILAIIAGAIAGAFAITFKALGPGATKDRLAAANDLSVLEETLGRDGARASCITAPDLSTGTYHVYGQTAASSSPPNNGTCNAATGYGGYGNVSALAACTGAPYAAVCFGWPQLGTAASNFANSTCHVAVYTSGSPVAPATPAPAGNVMITRTEYTVPMVGSASSASALVDHYDTVHSPWVQGAAPSGYTAPSGYLWLRSLQATIIGTGVTTRQPQQTLVIHPIAVDPSGATSAITPSGSPC